MAFLAPWRFKILGLGLVLRKNDFASTQIFHRQARKDRKESQGLRIQPQTGDGNRPDCSGERILEPLESAGFSLRTNGEAVGTGVLCG